MPKNILTVVGITILFLGLAINPAVAVNPISDNEEDCNICPKVSKTNMVRLKSLINKVETLNNKLFVLSKLNPIVAERYHELSERITTLTKRNKELNSERDYSVICGIILSLSLPFAIISEIISLMWVGVEEYSLFWYLLAPFALIESLISIYFLGFLLVFNCIEFYHPWTKENA